MCGAAANRRSRLSACIGEAQTLDRRSAIEQTPTEAASASESPAHGQASGIDR